MWFVWPSSGYPKRLGTVADFTTSTAVRLARIFAARAHEMRFLPLVIEPLQPIQAHVFAPDVQNPVKQMALLIAQKGHCQYVSNYVMPQG